MKVVVENCDIASGMDMKFVLAFSVVRVCLVVVMGDGEKQVEIRSLLQFKMREDSMMNCLVVLLGMMLNGNGLL